MREKEFFSASVEKSVKENDPELPERKEGDFEHREERERKEDEQTVRRIKRKLQKRSEEPEAFPPKKIEAYIERNIPDYLRDTPKEPTFASKIFSGVMRVKEWLGLSRTEGRDHIPSGPSLVISNHSGGEAGALLGAFRDHPLRITAGNELNWKRSGFRSWLLKKFGMLSVNETLSNLSEEEKTELLPRVRGKAQQRAYRGIIDREKGGKITPNTELLKHALACLLRGDKVAFFPEGLFLYEDKRQMRKAYGGLEILAKKYKEMTGNDLPITPVGVTKGRVGIGEMMTLPEDTGGLSPTDWVMNHVAELLPKDERGYYGGIEKKILE